MATKKLVPEEKYLMRKADGVVFSWNANIAKRPSHMKEFKVIHSLDEAKKFKPENDEDNEGSKSVFDGIGKGYEAVVEEDNDAGTPLEFKLTQDPAKLNAPQLKDFAAQLGIDSVGKTRGQIIKAIIGEQAQAIHDKIVENSQPEISGDM